jgi:hypothetical protein
MCDVRVVRVPEVKTVLPFIGRFYSINVQSRIRTFFLCMYYNFVSVTCLARHALTNFQLSGSCRKIPFDVAQPTYCGGVVDSTTLY